jgi:hypothetical protein
VTVGARKPNRGSGGINTRVAARLAALTLWALVVALDVILVAPYQLDWYGLTHPFYEGTFRFGEDLASVAFVFVIPAYATLGAVIVSLRPKNGVGWLCFVPSLLVVAVGWPPGLGNVADLLQSLAWYLTIPPLPITLMLLIFPNGRLLSRRWWVVVGIALTGYIITAIAEYSPGTYAAVGLPGAAGLWLCLAALVASAVAVVLRWRRSTVQERRQLKWLAYVVTLTVVAGLGWFVSAYNDIPGEEPSFIAFVFMMAVVFGVALGIPVAVGIAILRYRLYDIDVIINRTLVYGTLTATLVAVYFGGIVVLQGIASVVLQVPIRALTGQETQLATVAATLAIAALFNPLRRRIQSFIDRRFYRSKYDAAKTLEALSAKLRDETDLDALSDDLVGVVRETMQPAHVSLWLRTDAGSKSKQAD